MSPIIANLMGTRIDVLGWEQVLSRILSWTSAAGIESSRMVCVCNVHSVVTARRDKRFADALRSADLCTADGAPVAWLIRRSGWPEQQRISGPELMWLLIREAERLQLPVFLLGGTIVTLEKLRARLIASFPGLPLAGQCSPAFREMTTEDDRHISRLIESSGARLVFVGLGCPKQELWMARHRGKLRAVMIGVGAAFDYHAGTLRRAPLPWQQLGLEWLYRLMMERARLLRRYLVTNTLFLCWLPGQLWKRSGR